MNKLNKELERFFEYDVKDAIPALADDFLDLMEDPDIDRDTFIKTWQIRIKHQDENGTTYIMLDEPYIKVEIYNDHYSIQVADQLGERMFFRTIDPMVFVKHWNTDIVGTFGQDAHFPEIHI